MLSLDGRFRELEQIVEGQQASLSFLSPITACGWAALLRSGIRPGTQLTGDGQSYAHTIGLADVMNGQSPQRQPQSGNRYSPLVELSSHAAVEPGNAVINELIRGQLADYPQLATQACIVTGELHDNVPSHARGIGFSMAQYYPSTQELELCVADCGQGMLRNVQKVVSEITDHAAAIQWCVVKENTTAREPDEWAQQLPEDAMHNPYGDQVEVRNTDNHHAGLGLWKLVEIIRATNGSLGVWSGNARWQLHDGIEETVAAPNWNGVVIGLRLPVAALMSDNSEARLRELEGLAKRLEL